MHIWKIINVEKNYGITRIVILSILSFIITFSLSYSIISLNKQTPYTDQYFLLFVVSIFLLYPLHKFFHYLFLIDYRKHMRFKIKFSVLYYPILTLKISKLVPKYRYILSLLAPFLFLNAFLLFCAIYFSAFSHYFCLLFGLNCLICLIDLLNVNGMIRAPHQAYIEETPKGFEVLVPIYSKD
jgi:hypothetical protein